MQYTVVVDGVTLRASSDRVVSYCSDWLRVSDLEAQGFLTHKHYPALYGHVDYILTDKAIREASRIAA